VLAVDTPARLGGRMAHRARVSWEDGAGSYEEVTETPTRFVRELAERYGGEVPGLQVRRPSLEDVYLSMIGTANGNGGTAA
jgi:ABC-2 type transport system ATP-binding protein